MYPLARGEKDTSKNVVLKKKSLTFEFFKALLYISNIRTQQGFSAPRLLIRGSQVIIYLNNTSPVLRETQQTLPERI